MSRLYQEFKFVDDPMYRDTAIRSVRRQISNTLMDGLEFSTPQEPKIYTIELREELTSCPFDYHVPMMKYSVQVNVEEAQTSSVFITKLDYDFRMSSMPKWLKSILRKLYPDG